MKPKCALPANRTYEQIRNHYLVEKQIAERLKNSTREERRQIYATMYDELFRKVPDHPRLSRRKSEHLTERSNRDKLSLTGRFIENDFVFAEFAPGDCKFVIEMAKKVRYAYGIDISDQHDPDEALPDNMQLIIYDGYTVDGIPAGSVDLVFSDQLIEHLHPEDTRYHFELVHRILKPGGKYVFRTPHSLNGPADVSKYFSDTPEGFHLKEWTYREIKRLLKDTHFSRCRTYLHVKGKSLRMPYVYFALCETIFGAIPKRYVRSIVKLLIPSLYCAAIK